MPPSPFSLWAWLKTEKRFKHISESTGRMDHQSFQEYNARSRSLMLASTTYYLAEVVLLAGLVCMGTQEKRKKERKEARRPSSRATAMEATAAASTHAASERRLLAAVMIACRESEPFSPPGAPCTSWAVSAHDRSCRPHRRMMPS